jgi:hypothetical protein
VRECPGTAATADCFRHHENQENPNEGFWLADVKIHAMRGETERALAALREAVDDGAFVIFGYDPVIASLPRRPTRHAPCLRSGRRNCKHRYRESGTVIVTTFDEARTLPSFQTWKQWTPGTASGRTGQQITARLS